MNPNVTNTLAFIFFQSISKCLLTLHLLSNYVLVLTGSNTLSGLVRATHGFCVMLGSIPTAILADGYTRRDTCLRISALVGCVAIPFLTYAFQQMQLAALLVGYAALGLFFGSFVPPMEALFIDSTPFGQRTRPLVVKNNVMYGAMTWGSVVGIMGFLVYGNQWELPQLNLIMFIALGILVIPCGILFFFNDDNAVDSQEPKHPSTKAPTVLHTPTLVGNDLMDVTFDECDAQREVAMKQPTEHSSLIEVSVQTSAEPSADGSDTFGFLRVAHMPFLIYLADTIVYQADGMVVSFVSVFFMNEFQVQPIQMEIITLFQSSSIFVFSSICSHLSRRIGRMRVIILMRLGCFLCLGGMAMSQSFAMQVALFLLRVGLTLSVMPLSRSLLMDMVPQNERARWNAIDTVMHFAFAGSAILGGYIIDRTGSYRINFVISAVVTAVGICVDMLLLPLQRKQRARIQTLA